jgi:predicted O-methyltransferase YrrM
MSTIYATPQHDALVSMDAAHAMLLAGLVAAQKPRRVLEMGFGAGTSFRSILQAADVFKLDAEFTIVDNWFDHSGVRPVGTFAPPYNRALIVTQAEGEFVASCTDQYDFIVSDADHHHSHLWFDEVYDRMLAPGGILVNHDVCNLAMFPNLARNVARCQERGLMHMVFDRNSLPHERCDRGLLVIWKPSEA